MTWYLHNTHHTPAGHCCHGNTLFTTIPENVLTLHRLAVIDVSNLLHQVSDRKVLQHTTQVTLTHNTRETTQTKPHVYSRDTCYHSNKSSYLLARSDHPQRSFSSVVSCQYSVGFLTCDLVSLHTTQRTYNHRLNTCMSLIHMKTEWRMYNQPLKLRQRVCERSSQGSHQYVHPGHWHNTAHCSIYATNLNTPQSS